ncbi:IucA/IucC family protein [Streptomyces sp. H27-S2]|uniref:IucA/IucC family protein n=1 Tax=Streptomyces antarcticus TaxID=2996458 RepID=UPI003B63AF23
MARQAPGRAGEDPETGQTAQPPATADPLARQSSGSQASGAADSGAADSGAVDSPAVDSPAVDSGTGPGTAAVEPRLTGQEGPTPGTAAPTIRQTAEATDPAARRAPGQADATARRVDDSADPAAGGQVTVPRQKDGTPRQRAAWTGLAGAERAMWADPLDHPDPAVAADTAAVENLLRCWVREAGIDRPDGAVGTPLRVSLPASGTALLVAVRHWSPAGWHRFAEARLEGAPADAPAVDAVTLAALIAREGATGTGTPAGATGTGTPAGGTGTGTPAGGTGTGTPAGGAGTGKPAGGTGTGTPAGGTGTGTPAGGAGTGKPAGGTGTGTAPSGTPAGGTGAAVPGTRTGSADLVGRVADSVRRTAEFIADRREHPAAPAPVGEDRFLTAEQSLLLGHPLQPDPKSREGLSESEVRRYSPELHGSFPLHWFAVAPSALVTDSAWTESGRPVSAARLLGRLAPGIPLPDDATPLPLHPWQARELLQRPAVAALLDAELLHDLGPYGAPWYPTSSIRTVHRPGAPAMLKLSLGLRITNSRRENLRKELHRGVEVHRLLRTGLAEQWQAAHPGFDIVRDPAWVAVDAPDGTPVPGLDALLRHNPFRSGDDAVCVAALTSPRPGPERPGMRSRLADIVRGLAVSTGHTTSAVAAEWFLRYLDHVVLPVLAFDALAGIALEAHQQNTLVLLDPAGWPIGGRYRDNQGYYFRASRRAELERRLPGIGGASDTFVSDAVTDERFAYYLGINNVLGLIGAFGSQQLADERVLLAAFRRFLGKAADLGPLPTRLLDSPTLRCKANLLTRLGGLDELVGPVDTQSVYVTIANPLHD